MKASAGNNGRRRNAAGTSKPHAARSPGMHMRNVPDVAFDDEFGARGDRSFADEFIDAIDPNLRHRLVSEAACRRHGGSGYDDGYDLDDWLQAQADVDHLLFDP